MNHTGVVSTGSRLQARRNRDSGADINHYRSIAGRAAPMRSTKRYCSDFVLPQVGSIVHFMRGDTIRKDGKAPSSRTTHRPVVECGNSVRSCAYLRKWNTGQKQHSGACSVRRSRIESRCMGAWLATGTCSNWDADQGAACFIRHLGDDDSSQLLCMAESACVIQSRPCKRRSDQEAGIAATYNCTKSLHSKFAEGV